MYWEETWIQAVFYCTTVVCWDGLSYFSYAGASGLDSCSWYVNYVYLEPQVYGRRRGIELGNIQQYEKLLALGCHYYFIQQLILGLMQRKINE